MIYNLFDVNTEHEHNLFYVHANSNKEYVERMREKYKSPQFVQLFYCAAKLFAQRSEEFQFSGPFANDAKKILIAISESYR